MTQFLGKFFAALVALIGLFIVGFWLLDQQKLIAVNPDLVVMVFNTALCFILIGGGLLLPESRPGTKKIGGVLLGLVAATVAALVLSQDVTGRNLGIDTFFVRVETNDYNPNPGRMSPITAVCFILCGFSLVLLSVRKRAFTNLAVPIMVLLVIAGAIVGIITASVHRESFGIRPYERMATLTAICFLMLAAALWLAHQGQESKEAISPRKQRPAERYVTAFPLALFIALTVFSLYLHDVLKRQEFLYIKAATQAEANKIEELALLRAENILLALQRAARRWEASNGTTYDEWRLDARNYNDQLGGSWTALTDKKYRLRWTEPPVEEPVVSSVLPAPQEVLSAQQAFVKEDKDFVIHTPLRVNGQPDGLLISVYPIRTFFEGVLLHETKGRYAVHMALGGKELFRTPQGAWLSLQSHQEKAFRAQWVVDKPFRLFEQDWIMSVVPTESFVQSQRSLFPALLFLIGLLIAFLFAGIARYVLLSRIHSSDLAESNELNRAILASTASLVIAGTDDGSILLFNRAAEEALGYKAEEIIGRQTPLIWHDKDEVAARAAELSLETGETVPPGIEVFKRKARLEGVETREWTFIRKDGSSFIGSLTMTPLRNAVGEKTGFLGVIEDITQRKRLERLKDDFITAVSHELRTPLTSIHGALGLITGNMANDLPEKVLSILKIAYRNSARLLLLVGDILDLEKMETGHMKLENKKESLSPLVRRAAEAGAAYAEEFGVAIRLEGLPQDVEINVDAARFTQVLSHLLSNAAKFSPSGGEIRISAVPDRGKVRVCVADSGPGIPREFRPFVFKKFLQGESIAYKKGGTGLGLYITKELVERMGGKIGFETEIGKGTTFWVEFKTC